MEECIIGAWDVVIPGCGGTSTMSPVNHQSAPGVGVSSPCGAFSTWEMSVFVSGLSDLWTNGRIYDARMGLHCPRVQRDLDVLPRGNSRRALAP